MNHNTNTHKPEVVGTFKEEGPVTVESFAVTEEHHSHTTRKKGFALTTPSAIIIAAIILGLSHVVYGALVGGTGSKQPLTAFNGRAVDANDLLTGNTKSKVVVVEYSDTECPFCARLQPTIQKLKQEYGDKVAFTYRYFPLTQIHPHAFEEARALYCVGKLLGAEKRATYIDQLFNEKISKQNMVLPNGKKEMLAKALGANDADMKSCMTGTESSDAITASMQDGASAGVQGTPATFVLLKTRKGYDVVSMVDGARPYENFKAAVDEALSR